MAVPSEFSDELIDKLLDKLSSDDEFRAVFQRSPRIAVAYLGHEGASNAGPDDQGAWSGLKCEKLVSAKAIKASRDELHRQMKSSYASLQPIRLEG